MRTSEHAVACQRVALALLLTASPSVSEDPPPVTNPAADAEPGTSVKEKMSIFRAYEGEWEGVQKYAEVEGKPAFESKDTFTGKFVLDDMYFEMAGKSEYPSGVSSYRWMITFDAFQQNYRAWTFGSNGIVTEWTGEYKDAHKEMIWKFKDSRTATSGWLRTTVAPNKFKGIGAAKTENRRLVSDYSLEFRRKKIRI
jgi:hypothetical protein